HLGPVRFLHGQQAFQRAQAPVEQELGFLFLRRDEAHRLLVQAGRYGVGFNVRDEAVLVATGEHGFKLCILSHRFTPATTPLRSRTSKRAKWRGLLSSPASSASVISCSDWRIAWLMRCQLSPTWQLGCRSQWLWPVAHSVRASGPSIASRM